MNNLVYLDEALSFLNESDQDLSSLYEAYAMEFDNEANLFESYVLEDGNPSKLKAFADKAVIFIKKVIASIKHAIERMIININRIRSSMISKYASNMIKNINMKDETVIRVISSTKLLSTSQFNSVFEPLVSDCSDFFEEYKGFVKDMGNKSKKNDTNVSKKLDKFSDTYDKYDKKYGEFKEKYNTVLSNKQAIPAYLAHNIKWFLAISDNKNIKDLIFASKGIDEIANKAIKFISSEGDIEDYKTATSLIMKSTSLFNRYMIFITGITANMASDILVVARAIKKNSDKFESK